MHKEKAIRIPKGEYNMTENMKWIREPKSSCISDERIEIVTEPHTDLWQRTYYHFRNDNAPVLQMETDEKYFSVFRQPKPDDTLTFRSVEVQICI